MKPAISTVIVTAAIMHWCAGLVSAQQDAACTPGVPVAFINVDVLTMESPALVKGQTVVVQNGTITALGSSASVPANACRIAGGGRVLMPGLADMHVHTGAVEMPLFLANGITLAREMNGLPARVALRDSITAGLRSGPRLIVGSPLMTRNKLPFRHRLITSAVDAAQAARDVKAGGYDFIKIYDGLTAAEYAAFQESAKTLGLKLDGHIPQEVGLEGVLAAGQTIEHMDKIVVALSGHTRDTAAFARLRTAFSANPVWVVPTLTSLRALAMAGTQEYRDRMAAPEMMYVDSGIIGWWSSFANGRTRPDAPGPGYAYQIAVLQQLKQLRVPFLLGTDCANPLTICGFSIHDELRALIEDAGFTPFEALATGTVNVGRFLGESGSGVVKVGATGNVILLAGNPLEDLAVLRAPHGVLANGVFFNRAQLADLLRSARLR